MVDTSSLSGVMAASGYSSSDSSGGTSSSNNSNSSTQSNPWSSSNSDSNATSVAHTRTRSRVDTSTLSGIEALSTLPTTAERMATGATSLDALATDDSSNTTSSNLTPLAGPAAMGVRREFNHAPFRAQNAYQAYSGLTANDFAGPTDMRLSQLQRATQSQNDVLKQNLSSAFPEDNITVGGRAKTPTSTFGKLQEAADVRIGDIKDLSGLRVDVDPINPGFADVYDAQSRVQNTLGDGLNIKQDYIQQPNRWGYTGRVHSTLASPNGLTHEVQVGTRDISNFIEMDVQNSNGQRISLHDATGYKGQIYGVDLPDSMQGQYTDLMGDIKQTNALGETISSMPQLQDDITRFSNSVEEALPDRIVTPDPTVSPRARVGNLAGQGMGVLGVVGGGFQTMNGVQTLASGGDKIEAAADVTAGTAGIVSGGALMTGRVALGTTTGGAVAVIDGGRDIYTGIRDGDLERAAVGGVKAGAGTAMLAGVATANPVLIAGGAAVYAGAVVYESRDAIVSGAKAAGGWVKSWFD